MKKISNKVMDDKFHSKLNKVKDALNRLCDEYGIEYSLNYLKKDSVGRIQAEDLLYSSNLSLYSLDTIVMNHVILQNRMQQTEYLISSGTLIARCIDDTNMPTNFVGDWIKSGTNYLIQNIVMVNGKPIYQLAGKSMERPYVGYASSRFEIQNCFSQN